MATISPVGRYTKSLAAGLFGLFLLFGVPLLLWRFVGNPLDGFPHSIDEARRLVDQRNVTTEFLVSVLACTMWFLWLQYVWALAWELLVAGPRLRRGYAAGGAPGVPRFVHTLVSAVLSGLLSAGVVVSSGSVGALVPDLVGRAPALAVDHGDQDVSTEAALAAPASGRWYVIGDNDRMWDLAGQNDSTLQRILEMNADQVRSPVDFRPGMRIRVPSGLALPTVSTSGAIGTALADPGPALGPESGNGSATDGPVLHTVVEGDNLWNISRNRIVIETGAQPSNQEIADRVAEVVDDNADEIEDPDLIYPGEVFDVSPLDADDESDTPVSPPVDVPPPADTAPPVDVPAPDPSPSSGPNDEERLASEPLSTVDPGPGVPLAPVAFGGVAAASALVGLFLAGRRRPDWAAADTSAANQSPNGSSDAESPPIDDEVDEELVAALGAVADRPYIEWVADQMSRARFAGRGPGGPVEPEAVALHAPDRLEVWFPEPVDSAPGPGWSRRDDAGRRWSKPVDGEQAGSFGSDKGDGASAFVAGPALPGYLTVGRLTDGSAADLLINLNRSGSLSVAGPVDARRNAARAMVFELGAGGHLANTMVTTVDFTIDGVGSLNRAFAAVEDEALVRAAAAGEHGLLRVYVVEATKCRVDRWMELARPGSGVAVIIMGDVVSSRLGDRLVIGDDGLGRVERFNASVVPVALDRSVGARLGRLVA